MKRRIACQTFLVTQQLKDGPIEEFGISICFCVYSFTMHRCIFTICMHRFRPTKEQIGMCYCSPTFSNRPQDIFYLLISAHHSIELSKLRVQQFDTSISVMEWLLQWGVVDSWRINIRLRNDLPDHYRKKSSTLHLNLGKAFQQCI